MNKDDMNKNDKIEEKIHVEMDNLAVPEIHLGDEDEEDFDDIDDQEGVVFSGAVPEIHIKNLKKS